MRKIFIAIALFAAIPVLAKMKYKQKSFDPIAVRDVQSVVGRYIGIEHVFEIELKLDANGKLVGSLVQDGIGTPMRDPVIDGSDLRSDSVRATFGDRVLNGDHRFGLRVDSPKVKYGETTYDRLFCRKQ